MGEFQRIGAFRVSDDWDEKFDWSDLLHEQLPDSQGHSDGWEPEQPSEDFSNGEEGSDQSSMQSVQVEPRPERGRQTTAAELRVLLESRQKKVIEMMNEPNHMNMKRRIQSQNGSTEDDRFCNRFFDSKLFDRYADDISIEDYPRINSILSLINAVSEVGKERDRLSKEPYGYYHGD